MSIFPRKVHDGDHLVVDDRTGFTIWARDSVKEALTGYRVERGRDDPRHPQEFLRTRADKQAARDPRPPGVALTTGPLTTETTAAASAGATVIAVTSTVRMQDADVLLVGLTNGDFFRVAVLAINSLTSITLAAALPETMANGAQVVDVSALSAVEYG